MINKTKGGIELGYLDGYVYIWGEKKLIKGLPQARYDQNTQAYRVPENPYTIRDLMDYRDMGINVTVMHPRINELMREATLLDENTTRTAEKVYGSDWNREYRGLAPGALFTPWEHQRRALEMALLHDGFGLFMEMGTGKTKVAIDYMEARQSERVLIVCPKAVIQVWLREIPKHTSRKYHVVPLMTGTSKNKAEEVKKIDFSGPVVVIANYESVWRTDLAKALQGAGFDTIIADEVHRIKSPSGKASRYLATLGRTTKYRLGLTGTPMPHSPKDIYAIYRFIQPAIFGTNLSAWESMYAIKGGFENRQIVAFKNLDHLHRQIYRVAYRILLDDAVDLPDSHDEILTFELSPKARETYDTIEREAVASLEFADGKIIITNNILTQLLRLQQITSGYLPNSALYNPDDMVLEGGDEVVQMDNGKKEVLNSLLQNMAPEEPVVIFYRFNQDLRQIVEVLTDNDRTFSLLNGQHNQLKKWQDEKTNALVVQIQTGGEGETFVRARYTIYYSLGYSLKDYEQSRFRIRRPGQDRKTIYYHLVAENTVDEKIIKALQTKKSLVDSVLEDLKSEQGQ